MRKIIKKAIAFAKEKHKGQKYNGKDFFTEHPFLVYKIIKVIRPSDYDLQIAALAHDCLEDTETTRAELITEFSFDVADLVSEVSKDSYNSFPNLKTQRGILLKLIDRACNVSNMESWSEEKKQKYLDKSKFWKGGK